MKHIIALSQQAQKGLLYLDPKFMFPNVHQFHAPGIMADINVEYTVQGTNIVTTVSLLHFPDSNPLEQVLSQFKNGTVIDIDGRVAHIVDKISVSSCLPNLSELETGLGVIEELCADFIRKYNTLF